MFRGSLRKGSKELTWDSLSCRLNRLTRWGMVWRQDAELLWRSDESAALDMVRDRGRGPRDHSFVVDLRPDRKAGKGTGVGNRGLIDQAAQRFQCLTGERIAGLNFQRRLETADGFRVHLFGKIGAAQVVVRKMARFVALGIHGCLQPRN